MLRFPNPYPSPPPLSSSTREHIESRERCVSGGLAAASFTSTRLPTAFWRFCYFGADMPLFFLLILIGRLNLLSLRPAMAEASGLYLKALLPPACFAPRLLLSQLKQAEVMSPTASNPVNQAPRQLHPGWQPESFSPGRLTWAHVLESRICTAYMLLESLFSLARAVRLPYSLCFVSLCVTVTLLNSLATFC